jgi:hypothetical protein
MVLSCVWVEREIATKKLTKLRSEELNNMYSSSNFVSVIKSKRTKLGRTVARMKDEKCTKIAFGETEGKNQLGRYRRSWEKKTDHRRILDIRDVLD